MGFGNGCDCSGRKRSAACRYLGYHIATEMGQAVLVYAVGHDPVIASEWQPHDTRRKQILYRKCSIRRRHARWGSAICPDGMPSRRYRVVSGARPRRHVVRFVCIFAIHFRTVHMAINFYQSIQAQLIAIHFSLRIPTNSAGRNEQTGLEFVQNVALMLDCPLAGRC